jgi:hypothetical protein
MTNETATATATATAARYVDADTLAVAKLVAAAEGITLAEAIADQLALFGSDQ